MVHQEIQLQAALALLAGHDSKLISGTRTGKTTATFASTWVHFAGGISTQASISDAGTCFDAYPCSCHGK